MNARFAFAEFEPNEPPIPTETPALVWNQAAAAEAREAEVIAWDGPVRRIIEDAPRRPRRPRVRRKRFAEPTPGKAREAAGEWLRDFSRHGPLQIRKIATRECRDRFLTVVTYTRW